MATFSPYPGQWRKARKALDLAARAIRRARRNDKPTGSLDDIWGAVGALRMAQEKYGGRRVGTPIPGDAILRETVRNGRVQAVDCRTGFVKRLLIVPGPLRSTKSSVCSVTVTFL